MKKFNKILSIILSLIIVLSFTACSAGSVLGGTSSGETELEKYVSENSELIESSFEEGFSSGGMTCDCTVSAEGNTLYFSCNIDGINDLPQDVKDQFAIAMEEQKEVLTSQFTAIGDEIPMDEVVMEICEEDGDVIVVLNVPLN